MKTIYWMVETQDGAIVTGVFTDLKTLRGSNRRLIRRVPGWKMVESRFDRPFASAGV